MPMPIRHVDGVAEGVELMTSLYRAAAAAVLVGLATVPAPASAVELPAIRASSGNNVPECATPGRLMAFLGARNGKLDQKFERIADAYMRHGEELGLRWDIAFFQMLLETGNLTFTGDVNLKQNNFAGLGATGRGAPGESFPDVATGVRAHLEHILMYSGAKVDKPVAERTRKVQEWGVLTGWQKGIKGPMTYQQLARQWAPRSKKYAHDIETVADSFYDVTCKATDPHPEWVQEARAGGTGGVTTTAAATQTTTTAAEETPGQAAARRSIEDARADGNAQRTGLGATTLAKAADAPAASADAGAAKPQPAVTIINGAKPAAEAPAEAAIDAGKAGKTGASVQTVSAATSAKQLANPAVGAAKDDKTADKAKSAKTEAVKGKCNVWTASYGGQKAIIIRAITPESTNFTVLDVNEGAEKREAEAYIAAYAKDGEMVGEFQTSDQALDKAFELCPEG